MESDDLLVQRAKKGEARAFEALVMRYARMVFAAAFGVLEDPEAARDVSQEVFMKAWLKIKSFRGESRFSTWLYSVARHAALDHLRKERLRATPSLDEVPEPSRMPDLKHHILERAMETLEPREREALNLHYRGGLSAREVGEILGLSEGNVRVIMFRARKKLREHLRGRENELLGS